MARLGPAEMFAIRSLLGGKRAELKYAALSRFKSMCLACRAPLDGRSLNGQKKHNVVPQTNNRIGSDNSRSWI